MFAFFLPSASLYSFTSHPHTYSPFASNKTHFYRFSFFSYFVFDTFSFLLQFFALPPVLQFQQPIFQSSSHELSQCLNVSHVFILWATNVRIFVLWCLCVYQHNHIHIYIQIECENTILKNKDEVSYTNNTQLK